MLFAVFGVRLVVRWLPLVVVSCRSTMYYCLLFDVRCYWLLFVVVCCLSLMFGVWCPFFVELKCALCTVPCYCSLCLWVYVLYCMWIVVCCGLVVLCCALCSDCREWLMLLRDV